MSERLNYTPEQEAGETVRAKGLGPALDGKLCLKQGDTYSVPELPDYWFSAEFVEKNPEHFEE